jgi:cytochrome P450
MTLSIQISSQAEERLRRQARAAGKEIGAYVAELVEQVVARSALDELLAPLRQQFAGSGVSDEQLVEQITEAQDAYRAGRTKRPA